MIILRYDISDNSIAVNAYIENNTDTDLSAVSVLAIYDSTGKMKALESTGVNAYKYDSTTADFAVKDYKYASGDYVKLFLWADLNSLAPVCKEEYSTLIKN